MSATIFLPLRRTQSAALRCFSTAATSSPKRKVTDRSRRWYFRDSTISSSQKSSIRGRRSTTVTLVPSAANRDAYSMPMTPAPTTTMLRGTAWRLMTPSESTIVRSSKSTLSGRAGRVPAAMTALSKLTRVSRPEPASTQTEWASANRPVPVISEILLRASWLRMTSVCRVITCWVRAARSATVMSSLTR